MVTCQTLQEKKEKKKTNPIDAVHKNGSFLRCRLPRWKILYNRF
jgi:hypothetical protein